MQNGVLSDLIITDIISATTIYTNVGAKVRRNCRKAWAFVLKYEGETEYFCNGRYIISNANELVILPRGSVYEWVCHKSGHCMIIDFECDAKDFPVCSFHVGNPERLLRIFRDIEYKMTLRNSTYRQECIKELYEIILLLAKERYAPSSKTEKLSPALDYIAKNYASPIKNDELAQMCGLSTVYFRKLFAELFATSPISYIHSLRIKKAKEMLASDFASISEIAQSLGYRNIYDFSRVFKKHTGTPPSRYR